MPSLVAPAFIQNVGPLQLIIILVIVLILFGPKSLPSLGRSIGQGLRELRKASSKFSDALHDDEHHEPEKRTPPRTAEKKALPADQSEQPSVQTPPTPTNTVSTAPRANDNADQT